MSYDLKPVPIKEPAIPSGIDFPKTGSPIDARTEAAANVGLAKSPQETAKTSEKQYSLISNELIVSPLKQSSTPIQTKEEFKKRFDQVLKEMIDNPPKLNPLKEESGDVEEITEIDSPAVAAESTNTKLAHAQDIVHTLSPFIAADWDAEHGEGAWASMLESLLFAAFTKYSMLEGATNYEELVWIAVSQLVAETAGLSPESCCPQFPSNENRSANDSEALNRWQALKVCLLAGAASGISLESCPESRENGESYLQLGLSYLWSGLSYLSTTITAKKVGQLILLGGAIWAMSSIPGASATVQNFNQSLGNLSSAFPTFHNTFGAYLDPAMCYDTAQPIIQTVAENASWSYLSALPKILPKIQRANKYFSNKNTRDGVETLLSLPVYIKGGVIQGIMFDIGCYAFNTLLDRRYNENASMSQLLLSPHTAALLFATDSFLPGSMIFQPIANGFSSSLNYMGISEYLGQATTAMTAAGGAAWDYAAGAVQSGAALSSAHPYLTMAALAIGASLLYKKVIRPTTSIHSPDKETELYEKKNVVCTKGTFNIKVYGPPDLSLSEREDLFNAFIKEMLEKNPVRTVPGDKIEFRFQDAKTWTVNVTPKDGNAAGRTLTGQKSYEQMPSTPSNIASIKNLETLHKVMVNSAHAVMEDLRSITTEKIPNNAPAVIPVMFSNAPSALLSAVQALLAIPEMRYAMQNSNNSKVSQVALMYGEKIAHCDSAPIDLSELEEALNPTPRWLGDKERLNSHQYEKKLIDLMSARDDLSNVCIARSDREQPSLGLQIPLSDNNDNLQKLVNDKQTLSNTQFSEIPKFLQISLNQATHDHEIKQELQLNWNYIALAARPPLPEENPPKLMYLLQSFILHTASGEITYQRTVENINEVSKIFYWKIDPGSGSGIPKIIDENEFLKNANSKDPKDLFFLRKEENWAVQAHEIIHERYDSQNNPNLKSDPLEPIFWEYNTRVAPRAKIDQAALENNPVSLRAAVKEALQEAGAAGRREISLRVPVGQEANGMNWPIGIVCFAVQEYLQENPGQFDKVKLAIDKRMKRDEKREFLIQEIDQAIALCKQYPDQSDQAFLEFSRAWMNRSKPRRHGWFF
jgi:hypothetical protein